MSTIRIQSFVVAAVVLLSAFCRADQVSFATSNTLGCFSSTACTPGSNHASTTDLSFAGTSFGQPNGVSTTNGSLSVLLGTFTLTDQSTTFLDTNFNSTITFTLPVTIAGGSSTSAFSADVLGLIVCDAFGIVSINFDNTPQHFTFSNSQYSGSFDFNVSDLLIGDLGSGTNTVNWYGQVSNAVETRSTTSAPEPGAIVLLGSGLASIGLLRRRYSRFL